MIHYRGGEVQNPAPIKPPEEANKEKKCRYKHRKASFIIMYLEANSLKGEKTAVYRQPRNACV